MAPGYDYPGLHCVCISREINKALNKLAHFIFKGEQVILKTALYSQC